VALLDVDHFKRFNDLHGHEVGDRVLVGVAGALEAGARAVDEVARWGGEEFLVLLPDCGESGAADLAERLAEKVRALRIEGAEGPLSVTATFGVAARGGGEGADALLRRADAALYRGKQAGRDRVVVDTAVAARAGETRNQRRNSSSCSM
jgi:diguanylate cyclase (GGDEF)-like protein